MPFTIANCKDLALSKQPLLLADITLALGGGIKRYATHAVTFGGNAYEARIANKSITPQTLAEMGIDVPTSVTLELLDADNAIWNGVEVSGVGFKGARLKLRFVMYDVLASEFSTDSYIMFSGQCREPGGGKLAVREGVTVKVGFGSDLSLGDVFVPSERIQRGCTHTFPTTLAQRQAGADTPTSDWYRCAYAPDATGSNARGNYQTGTTPFTTCNLTKADCVARGMHREDSSSRRTGTFGGYVWNPPVDITVRSYGGASERVHNPNNTARYGDPVPDLYGKTWAKPIVISSAPGGNFLKVEALLCDGSIGWIWRVIVAGVDIPHTYNDSLISAPADGSSGVGNATDAMKTGWWKVINNGSRYGQPCNDLGFTDSAGVPEGDPHASRCAIEIVIPNKLASSGTPDIQILCARGTSNPSLHIAALLQKQLPASALDTDSFNTAEYRANASVTYANSFGSTSSHSQFQASVYLRQREPLTDVLRGLKASMRGILSPGLDGLIRLRVKQGLADQQPFTVPGSNSGTPIASVKADGSSSHGYPAYWFDSSNTLSDPLLAMLTAGNNFTYGFEDQDNKYGADTFNPFDSEDIGRLGRDVSGQGLQVRGIQSYDQHARVIGSWLAEQNRGNWAADTRGTVQATVKASFRFAHLTLGDLVVLDYPHLGINAQVFRVRSLAPSINYKDATLVFTWHEDAWYEYTWGQRPPSEFKSNARSRNKRPAWAWLPFGEQPVDRDSWYAGSQWGFKVAPIYKGASDGKRIAKIAISGKQPVNATVANPSAPYTPIQGNTANTGGTVPGGRTYYFRIAGKNAAGKLGAPSDLILVYVPTGTATNTCVLDGIGWAAGTSSWSAYGGKDPNKLSLQLEGTGTPASITITAIEAATVGAPDSELDHLQWRVKPVYHSGVWDGEVASSTSTSITLAVDPAAPFTAFAGWTPNQWVGYDVSALGRPGAVSVPIANWIIESNSADTLILHASPGVVADASILQPGDLLVIRSKPTYGTDGTGTYLQDANWQNVQFPSGMNAGEEEGRHLLFIHGTGAGQIVPITGNTNTKLYATFAEFTPDDTSRYIVVASKWDVDQPSTAISNDDPDAPLYAEIEVPNVAQTYLVKAYAVDSDGQESPEATTPEREIYLYGAPAIGGYTSVVRLNVDGTLAIGSDLAPRTSLLADVTARAVRIDVKQAPVGADLTVKIYAGTAVWMTLTITAAGTMAAATNAQIAATAPIPAGANIRLDITGVGGWTYPGADLSASIYL